ncbi:MAG: LTA synthase family protein [Sulfuricurvum sp.]|uniref:LTA synthase family protein n=1 Tax=Algoriphagus sp. TaxID=1872435 RepID=UPI0027306E01|nr:LTA synthase family protein [Algoriphagus sp.]MDP2039904.1 LTA synthase family protein [Algoriphagus sp.]MDP3464312.1 LTA synthase family protein [Sulfuricurvum sp.]
MAQKAEIRSTLPLRVQNILRNFWGMALIFTGLIILFRIAEVILVFQTHVLNFSIAEVLWSGLYQDAGWLFYFLGLLFIIYGILSLISALLARILLQITLTIFLIAHLGLVFYFTKTLVPLGKDLFAYNWNDLVLTVSASGQLNTLNLIFGSLAIALILGLLYLGIKVSRFGLKFYAGLTAFLFLGLLIMTLIPRNSNLDADETKRNIALNKSKYLTEESFDHWMYGGEFYFDFYLRGTNDDLLVKKDFTNDEFPFLHKNNYPDVLSPFFDSLTQAPDLVFIFVESLGKAYSGRDAYLGSFTPFLDSLEQHSLVWTNALSSTGRTFGLLPGVFGGLPFGEKGFLELYQEFPHHQSLLSVLGDNDYETRYFIGADKNFDRVADFLNYQKPVQLEDESTFLPQFTKTPSKSGFSWGYPDKDLFLNGLQKLPSERTAPQLRIFQMQTSHDPYIVPEREFYQEKLQNHLRNYLNLSNAKISEYMSYQDIYMTILYADDAVKLFINAYKNRPEFSNTIFIITGDHRLPEIPMVSRIDRFHVPLLIYSPLLKRRDYFKGVASHYEITPSLLAMLEKQNLVTLPEEVIWQGQVLDTARNFQSLLAMPLMRNKNQLLDYIHGEFFLSDGQVFLVSDGMNIDPIEDNDALNRLNGEFEEFKNKNSYMVQTRKLLPIR